MRKLFEIENRKINYKLEKKVNILRLVWKMMGNCAIHFCFLKKSVAT